MKKISIGYIGGIILSISCIVTITVSAQENTIPGATNIPTIITQNCLLTPSGGIDYCPAYRQTMRTLNSSLAIEWGSLLSSGIDSIKKSLDTQINSYVKDKLQLIRKTPQASELFMSEYKQYITRLFRNYIEQNTVSSQTISSFFKTTYFNTDQSGLGITHIKIYSTIPAQYDDQLTIEIGIRNYSILTIDTIESLYCFTTLNGQDFIFPIEINNAFQKNSITNIVAPVLTKSSPLLDQFGQKQLFCTLVYSVDGIERYTNRGSLEFTMKE